MTVKQSCDTGKVMQVTRMSLIFYGIMFLYRTHAIFAALFSFCYSDAAARKLGKYVISSSLSLSCLTKLFSLLNVLLIKKLITC